MEIIKKKFAFFSFAWSRQKIAAAIALIVYIAGAAGILFFDRELFIRLTPAVLLLNFLLLIWTQPGKNFHFLIFVFLSFVVGILAEIIGVNTGLLFGNYRYSGVLSIQVGGVPLLMGLNWFVLAQCSGICIHHLFHNGYSRGRIRQPFNISGLSTYSTIVNGALLTTFFDWVMEPVAVRLGYWTWMGNGNIPGFNYACWFAVSMLILFFFQKLSFDKNNMFAVHLMLMQLLFFLVLRAFL